MDEFEKNLISWTCLSVNATRFLSSQSIIFSWYCDNRLDKEPAIQGQYGLLFLLRVFNYDTYFWNTTESLVSLNFLLLNCPSILCCPPELCTWIGSFLSKGLITIVLDGRNFNFHSVNVEVPQGSVLPSILIFLFIVTLMTVTPVVHCGNLWYHAVYGTDYRYLHDYSSKNYSFQTITFNANDHLTTCYYIDIQQWISLRNV